MKTVLINGGSRGIGAAMVRAFRAAGYWVAFTYFASDAEAAALAAETGATAIKADSGSREEIFKAVDMAYKALGKIDVLVNNAAISCFGLFTDMPSTLWDRMLAVNLDGPMHYAKLVLPHMIARKKGKIINISSMWGQVGASCEVHYSATKAALIGFTKALAKEVGPSGITVNAIAPGAIETEMNARLSEEELDALREETPLGRLGTPEEVAAVALFLCEKGGDFITGQVLSPNGGFVM